MKSHLDQLYISSSLYPNEKMDKILQKLINLGIKKIELSGGSIHYTDVERDLILLKKKHLLSYNFHNYFPPPEEDFVLNLASLNDQIYEKSLQFCINAIKMAIRVGAERIGFHAGFLVDFSTNEIGKKIEFNSFYDKDKALHRFFQSIEYLQKIADNKLTVYFENNVFSTPNRDEFNGKCPFLLTTSNDYYEYINKIEFPLLLDLAHLYVSSTSLNLNFEKECAELIKCTDYLHISHNNGHVDQHAPLIQESPIVKVVQSERISNAIITLELSSEDGLLQSIDTIRGFNLC